VARCLIALLLVVSACAEEAPPTLEAGSLVSALPDSIWPENATLVTEVACPDLDIELIAQAATCTAALDGDVITVDVRIDDVGAAETAVREDVFVVADAGAELGRRLAEDLDIAPPDVTCDRTVLVVRPDAEVSCEATHDGRPIAFTLRLLDGAGSFSLELDERE
jgi:hypothetical protein